MLNLKVRARTLSALVGVGITCGGLVAAGGSAHAAGQATGTCPTVSSTGKVTPAPTPGVNWSGCFLYLANLSGADLSAANLSGAELDQVNLTGANLSGADLPKAAFTDSDLADAHLSGANLTGALLTSDNLSAADLAGATLAHVSSVIFGTPAALPPNWVLANGHLAGPEADLRIANLADASLSDADLAGADLTQANLQGASLAGTDLSNASLVGARLTGADVSGANLTGSTLGGVSSGGVTALSLPTLPAHWNLLDGYFMGPLANLSGSNLAGLDLSGVDLASANITNADVAGTALAQANVTGVRSGGLTGIPASLPPNTFIANGYLAGPDANLEGARLSNLSLAGVDLARADLDQADLTGTSLADADLSGTVFITAKLTGANLAGANVASADFLDATLTSADLSQTDLSSANLQSVLSGDVTGIPNALPPNWLLLNGYLIGPGANLFHASLAGANLAGVDLEAAGLAGTDLSSATLTGANLVGGYFSGTNLTGAQLANANLTDAYFNGANLTDANLSGDVFTNAVLTGNTWGNTTCPDGSNSNEYVAGCFSPLDTTPPTVAVTGVSNGKVYVIGAVPAAHCTTTDNGTVATPATVKVTTTGRNGVGRFTATCSGAADLAGNKQKAPVSVTYTVVYGLHGFIVPANGATIARSSKTITVRFRLTSASGVAISASLAKALAAAHDVRVTLQGPAIKAVTVYCGWNASQQDLTCAIGIPSGVRTGTSQKYTLTATENVGTGFLTVPVVKGGADPEVIHFR